MANPNSKNLEDNEIVVITFQVAIRRSRRDGLEHEWKRVIKECGGVMTIQIKPADQEKLKTREFDRAQDPRRPDQKKAATATLILHADNQDKQR